MDNHPTPFPGKSQSLKSKPNKKTLQAPRGNFKEPAIQSQRRVFGTTGNPNIPQKAVTNDVVLKTKTDRPGKGPTKKLSLQISPKQPELSQSSITEKKSHEKNRATVNKKKKSVGFEEPNGKSNTVALSEGDVIGPRTPVVESKSLAKPKRVSGTPYQSAERCSKCQFDRLETSAYWLGQIKLSESVGKHFASAAFFRLAHQSKAKPIGCLRLELKQYVTRHEYLSTETEWRDVSVSYGLIRTEDDANSGSSSVDEAQDTKEEEQATKPVET